MQDYSHGLRIVENIPLDTVVLERMIADPDDLHLVWPQAEFPFSHQQWRAELDPANGTVSFLVYTEDECPVGHGALAPVCGDRDSVMVRFLYISPELRSRGAGRELLSLLDNERAMNCYGKFGFREYSREGTLVMMEKEVL